MGSRRHVALTVVLVAIVALAAVAANIALLRSTGDTGDSVGRLSPRAVFTGDGSSGPAAPPVSSGDDRRQGGKPDD